jgi:hypothetical protein
MITDGGYMAVDSLSSGSVPFMGLDLSASSGRFARA